MSRIHWGRTGLRQQIIKELERQAREKQRWRREQERQLRQEEAALKLEQRKSEAQADFTLIQNIKQQLVAEDLLRLVETEQLEARLAEIRAAIQSAQKLGELAMLRKELKSLGVEWRNLRTQAVADSQAEKVSSENAEKESIGVRAKYTGLSYKIADIQTTERAAFILNEINEMNGLLLETQSLISRKQISGAARLLEQVEIIYKAASHQADYRENAFWERMTSLEPVLSDLELSIAALGQNIIAKGWCGAKLEELTGKVAAIRPALDLASNALDMATIESIAQEMALLNEQGDLLLKEAEDKELREQQRAYVVNGIHNVLRDMGFVLDHGPDLLNPDDPASTVIIAAALPTGKNVAVKVNQNGAIYTDFDGYPDDGCVQDVHRFKDNLMEKFAIDYEIRGEQVHNPDKIKKGARGVPGGANAEGLGK